MKRFTKRGFTIIELLVVVGIIGLLASIFMVNLHAANEKAKAATAAQQVRQIMIAAAIVYNDYGYYPPDSHSQVVCPKDIVIDPASGKKWGDFIDVCNDPWGVPYEWNNKCLMDDGTQVKRSADDPQAGCTAYSNDVSGPVGVIVNRDGHAANVEATCTGDNMCFGENGFPTYNWTAASATSGASTGSCQATNASTTCADLTLNQCTTRTGCSVAAATCSGNVSCSAYNSNQNSCTTYGCTFSTGSCSGTAAACQTWNGNAAVCSSQVGCTYDSKNAKCTGGRKQCSSFDKVTCSTQLNCVYSPDTCSGSPSCSSYTSNQCSNVNGCTWNTSVCSGSAGSCSSFTDSNSCSAQSGCTWQQ